MWKGQEQSVYVLLPWKETKGFGFGKQNKSQLGAPWISKAVFNSCVPFLCQNNA